MPNMQSILLRVQGLLAEHFTLTTAQVSPEQRLADLGIDSLSAIEFLFVLEDAFSISLSDQRGDLEKISDLVVVVENCLSAKVVAA